VPSALLCFAEELLVGRAVSLQLCPLAMSFLCPRSPAQLSSRGPAQDSIFSAVSVLPQGVLGAPGDSSVKQAEEITDILSHIWAESLLSSSGISFIRKRLGHENHLSFSKHETRHQKVYREEPSFSKRR